MDQPTEGHILSAGHKKMTELRFLPSGCAMRESISPSVMTLGMELLFCDGTEILRLDKTLHSG